MKNILKRNYKINIDLNLNKAFDKTRTRLNQELAEYVKYGPFTSFGFKCVVSFGLLGASYLAYTNGKNYHGYGVSYRRQEIQVGCFYGGFGGVVVGLFWPTIPFIGGMIMVYHVAEYASRKKD